MREKHAQDEEATAMADAMVDIQEARDEEIGHEEASHEEASHEEANQKEGQEKQRAIEKARWKGIFQEIYDQYCGKCYYQYHKEEVCKACPFAAAKRQLRAIHDEGKTRCHQKNKTS